MTAPQPDYSAFGRAARDAFATGRTYVEGYVIIDGEPWEHAWTVDAKGIVYDTAIARHENVSGYFGVPFNRDYLAKAALENKGFGILGGDARTRRRLVIGKDADFKEAHHPCNESGAFDALALDRASVREIDQDGRLGVEITNISKANICPYLGHEIPGAEQMRLDPDRVYYLFRDPKELAKAAPTFCNLPVLSKHVPVFAEDYAEEAQKYVVGATGSDCEFTAPYLRCSLKIWDANAIKAIQAGEQEQLSCGYHYTPDMTPGIFEGQKFDGVMRDIRGNHVALVREGRAGADVLVADHMSEIRWAELAAAILAI